VDPTPAGVHGRAPAARFTLAGVAWATAAEAVVPIDLVAVGPRVKQSPAEPPAFVEPTSSMSLDVVMVSLPLVPLPSAYVKVEPIVRQDTLGLGAVIQAGFGAALAGD